MTRDDDTMRNSRLCTRIGWKLHLPAAALLLVMHALVPGVLHAQSEPNHLYDKFQVSASLAEVLVGPKVKADGDASDGTDVNFVDRLGIDRDGLEPRFAVRWRPGRRHEIEAGYLFVNRSGERRLTQDITVKDTTFTAGLNLNSIFDADNAFLAYRYAFKAKEKTQIGAQLGLGAIFFKFGIDARAGVASGNDTLSASYGVTQDFIGPTAALGLYGRFRLGDRWYLEAKAGSIGASVENITATIFEGGVAGRYFVSEKIGFEVGYGVTSFKVTMDREGSGGIFDPSIKGSVKYSSQDIRLGVIAAFQ